MDLLRDAAAALGIDLSQQQLEAFQLYYEELIDWNQRVNLTAITDYEEVQIKHFLDSLTCLLAIDPGPSAADRALSVIDIGTGAGFPGLPLRLVRPGWRVVLVDSVRKKTAFLQHLVARLDLSGVEIVWGRAEELGRDPRHRERYDAALARAVAELPVLVEYALPLCRIGGRFVAQKGAVVEETGRAIEVVGGRLAEVRTVQLPTLDEPRHLVIIDKVRPTPGKYPRRPGKPAKDPLR